MYVSEEVFSRVVGALVTWRASGASRLAVGATVFRPIVSVSIVERDPQVLAFLDETKMGMDDLSEAISDVVDVLQAAVSTTAEDEFVAVRADAERFPSGEQEADEVARTKFRLVASTFDLEDLRARDWIKRTSKNHVAAQVVWEVSRKTVDQELETPQATGIPFALVRLRAESPDPTALFTDAATQVTMTVDHEDVEYLIRTLQSVRDALRAEVERSDG